MAKGSEFELPVESLAHAVHGDDLETDCALHISQSRSSIQDFRFVAVGNQWNSRA
jgi:hypothetical protein